MSDGMYGWCSSAPYGSGNLHKRHAIGYEKTQEGPTYESRGTSLAITGAAYWRYWVVWVCDYCARTWWVEDKPNFVEATA